MGTMLQRITPVKGLDAAADAFASTVYSDVVSMDEHNSVMFILHKGVGTTGTSTLTVQACDDVVPTNRTAVPFFYKTFITGGSDVGSALTRATAAGFTTTAGSSQLYAIEVRDQDLASTGYGYVQLKCLEVSAVAVLGGIIILMGEPKHAKDIAATVIA